jgi:S1-C subfamily serine protease
MPEDTKQTPDTTDIATQPAPAPAPAARDDKKPSHHRSVLVWRTFVALVIVAVAFGGGWLGARAYQKHAPTNSGSVETQRVVLGEQGDLISSIAKDVGESVVSINVTSRGEGYFGSSRDQESAGTGVIVSDDGLILTNRHVVPSGTTSVSIVLSDGTELDGVEVLDRTDDNDSLDVAFLKVNDTKGKTLRAAKIGDSSKMRVGDSVVAIGNALGYFQNTVTTGIVSGYGRSIQASGSSGGETESLEDLFQTDAAINQGNSGGPLVSVAGEVIGINTAVASGEAQNIGFAIPINNIKGLIDGVKETGKIQRPYLGVVYVPVTADLQGEYNLKIADGAYVPMASDYGDATIMADGPAAKAGVKEGDVITKIDSQAINDSTSLAALLAKHKPGDNVELTIDRGGAEQKIRVTLGTRP